VGLALAANNWWFSGRGFQAFFRFSGGAEYHIFLAPGSAALDTLGIDAVDITFQGEVSPASLASFDLD
jgi:hypothetical protein